MKVEKVTPQGRARLEACSFWVVAGRLGAVHGPRAEFNSFVRAKAAGGTVATHPSSPACSGVLVMTTGNKVAPAPELCDTGWPSWNRGASRILSP